MSSSNMYVIRITFADVDINPKAFDKDTKAWLSLDFIESIIQSEIFQLSNHKSFVSFTHHHDFQGSFYQLEQILNKPLTIHLCGDDRWYAKLIFQPSSLLKNRELIGMGSATFDFIDANHQSIGALVIDLEVHKSNTKSIDSSTQVSVIDQQDSIPLSTVERNLYEREKKLALAEAELERKIKESITRHAKIETAFLQHIRKKEDAVRLILENQSKKIEEEKNVVLIQYREEYKKLESRLKSALNEIEAKERDMNRQLSEMKVKQSILKEESQNAVENEITRAKILEEKLAEEKRKTQRLENELNELRSSYQASAQAKAENEVILLSRQIQDLESQVSKSNNELHVMLTEKDHYRQAAHKLAKLMREQRPFSSGDNIQPTTSRTGSRKNSEKLISLKAELSKISMDMDNT